MKPDEIVLLRTWCEGNRKALEWSVNGRTFQIMGLRRSEGLYERFFPKPPEHPTRKPISAEEILAALQNATTKIAFWRDERDREWFENAEAALMAAKAWFAQQPGAAGK